MTLPAGLAVSQNAVRVLLISDNILVNENVRRVLSSCGKNTVIAHLVHGADTLRVATHLRPDVVLVVGGSAAELHHTGGRVRRMLPSTRVFVMPRCSEAPVRVDRPAPMGGRPERLSDRELEVLQHVARAMTNRQIARELGVTIGTVKRHLHSVFRKLHAVSRLDAVVRGAEVGLIGHRPGPAVRGGPRDAGAGCAGSC